ncbi:alpha/beta hydrolase [Eubacteriales bacterium OttesenSCG-928-N13]|nr:alpha/beta hydrolase [Eubacteriales bacterium OttesenSCG-928-N13]
MKYSSIPIGEAHLDTYIMDDLMPEQREKRPLVLVCPGGGYGMTASHEGEPIALRMNAMGFHSAVLWYSVAPSVFPKALTELAKAVDLVRQHADTWSVDEDRIIVLGFSAGGHLAASLGVFWNRPFLAEAAKLSPDQMKPNGLVLCYPVITSGEFAHRGSFENLMGHADDPELLHMLSLETQVTAEVPPTFLWHTWDDEAVPVENALLLATALKKADVSMELHIYKHGVHGLSLANELTVGSKPQYVGYEACGSWPDLAGQWIHSL